MQDRTRKVLFGCCLLFTVFSFSAFRLFQYKDWQDHRIRINRSLLTLPQHKLVEYQNNNNPTSLDEKYSPKYAFITQTEKCIPVHWMDENHLGNPLLCDCHVYVLSYRAPCEAEEINKNNKSHIFYLHNTTVGWSGGRNLGYYAAKKHGYLYYVFFDDDVKLAYNTYTPRKYINNKTPPLRIFTDYLYEHRPAAAGTDFDSISPADHILNSWHKRCNRFEVPRGITLYHFDALFNAFHKDTVNYLLPYYDKYDARSFWLAQLHLCFLFQLVFYGRFEYVPYITAHNPSHRYTLKGHLADVDVRTDMVSDIRKRTTAEYRNHSRFQSIMNYDASARNFAPVLCVDPPDSRAPIIPYQQMEPPELF